MSQRLIVASNRGPVSWSRDDDGTRRATRGSGGLVTALGGALQSEDGTWVSVALDDHDAEVAAEHRGEAFEVDADGARFTLRLLDVGERYDPYYNEVANRMLWFTVHGLWGEPYEPQGRGWRDAWDAYRSVGDEVARAVVAAAGDADDVEIHLQDYHLCTATRTVRDALPRARILHYLHTPWVGPSELRRLPDPVAEGVVRGLLAADVVAVSSPTWARAFRRGAAEVAHAHVDGDEVYLDGHRTLVTDFVLGVDAEQLAALGDAPETAEAGRWVEEQAGDRALILRVDRTDLSKNILRGLHAFALLLERHPEHRGRVWHYAHLTPSRQGVDEYRDYLEACERAAARIAERFGDGCITLAATDHYPTAIAAFQRSDVLLTNPVRDGTNLVAKEGPVLNRRDGVLVLGRDAGAADVLADGALMVNAYDVEAQADALHTALTMSPEERAERAAALRDGAMRGAPAEWFAAQRATLRAATSPRVWPPAVMDVEGVRARVAELATRLPGAEVEDTDAGHAGFSVRGRRFAWFTVDHHGDGRLALSLKAPPGEQQALVAADPQRYGVPSYLGARGWVEVLLDAPAGPDWEEVAALLEQAWRLSASQRAIREFEAGAQ